MTRAMTLIKMFFVGSLRALSSDVSKKLSERVSLPLQLPYILVVDVESRKFLVLLVLISFIHGFIPFPPK